MPVVFAQPQPFSASLSAMGGAAEVATKDFPTLAQLYMHAASQNAGAGLASAQLQQQSRQNAGEQQQQSEMFGAQQDMRSSQMGTQANQATAEIQGRANDIQQRAVVQDWLSQQDLSRGEQMQLQQQQQGIAALQQAKDNGTITEQEFNQGVLATKTSMDELKKRQMASQQRLMDQQAQLDNQKAGSIAAQEQTMKHLAAAQANNTFSFVPDKTKQAAVEMEVEDGEGIPRTVPGSNLPQNPQFAARVQELMEQRGLGSHFFATVGAHGKPEMAPDPFEMAAKQAAAKQAAQGDKSQRGVSEEAYSKAIHQTEQDVDKWAKDQPTPPSEADKDKERNARMQRWKQQMDEFHGQRSGAASEQKQIQDTRQTITESNLKMKEIQDSALPPEQKQAVVQSLTKANDLLTRWKSYDKMPESVKTRFNNITQGLKSLKIMQPGGTQPPAAPAGREANPPAGPAQPLATSGPGPMGADYIQPARGPARTPPPGGGEAKPLYYPQ